ncbi:hypothetical protein PYW08_007852 [Mythimna loreyi]|uniref:Uncharacterized protein n=1 Tax=Mythimna loreyi TaxID=667449 RepID=A0ACC2QCX7_9NEOP|nr:hypothetical protein PYW08_007852 [Mythimna loreyi]
MAHQAEPMDIDSDFDNKENSLHHNNVLPFTEKGYEELDVSELNMKLRYSITPASSPMSKSYTANCVDNRTLESGDDTLNATINENSNLTRSLNSNMPKNDSFVKSLKSLPLQAIPSEQFGDNSRSTSVLRPLDTTVIQDNANVTVTVSGPGDIDENLSLLSSSSSAVQTPEATTPTKDNVKNDGGSSPIMRGIKSVLNMFRSSQSPIPPADSESIVKPDMLSPAEATLSTEEAKSQAMLASTPIAAHRKKEASPTKRNSPQKESIVFNEDLEKELQWKDETTILFSQERIPIHKLFFQHTPVEVKNANQEVDLPKQDVQDDMNSTVEYMDISYNETLRDKTMTEESDKIDCTITGESDAEFVDCETTFTKHDSVLEDNDKTPVNDKTQDLDLTLEIEKRNENTSASRLKQIILNTTQDILDATLSITPDDLIPEALLKIQDKSGQDVPDREHQSEIVQLVAPSEIGLVTANETIASTDIVDTQNNSIITSETLSALNETVYTIVGDKDQSMENTEVLNITTTAENVVQSVLNEAVATTIALQCNEELDNTKLMKTISSDTFTLDSQHNIIENISSTSNSETVISNEIQIEDKQRDFINDNDHNLTQNVENNLDTTNVSEHTSSNVVETANITINNTVTLEKSENEILLNPDDERKSSPVKEASMTELAAEIPLPDEDDLDKELNILSEQTDAAILPHSLSLDLVDNIKDQKEMTEIIDNLTFEKEIEITEIEANNEDKTALIDPKLNTSNCEHSVNIQNDTVPLDLQTVEAEPVVIKDNVNIEKPTEEPQVVTTDVLPETIPSINDIKNESKIDEVQPDIEVINKTENATECLNETVSYQTVENNTVTMDINESVIGPLPDIVNQTIVASSVENSVSTPDIPEPVVLEQPAILPENLSNVGNEVDISEIVPETAHIGVPELLSDISEIPKHSNELPQVIGEELPTTPANDEITKEAITTIEPTVDKAVATNSTTDTQLNNIDVISIDSVRSDNEKQPTNANVPVNDSADINTQEEEIVLSENNSPFVSVTAEENIDVQNIDNRLATAGKVVFTPPGSPPIASKGYNFNFDEIDDPFATKTKIRVSPSLDTPTKAVESKASSRSVEKPLPKKEMFNRRKSQPERKKPVAPKRKFNSTFSGAVKDIPASEIPPDTFAVGDMTLKSPTNVALEPSNVTIEDKLIEEAKIIHEKSFDVAKEVQLEQKRESEIEQLGITNSAEAIETNESATVLVKDSKSTSSSEQSAYFSAGASSNESFHSRNVFNIPEIDDMNFNPFVTKSKMRQSPPPNLEMENPFATKSKIRNSPDSSLILPQSDEAVKTQDMTTSDLPDDKIETELMEKDGSGNLSNTTTSSKATDEKNNTIREVNTEDEDTIEGPFLEADDLNTDDKIYDFDGENVDMMQFTDLPTQGNDENGDNGELFIDAEAFEFLLNQNKSNTVVDSGKESLFLKFDPLFAKRMSSITSENLVASLNKLQKRQSTPTKTPMPQEVKSPIAGPSNLNVTQDMDISHNLSEEFNEDLNITVSKPMMVVPPAVNPVTPRNKSVTPNRSNRRSITFTSPAMAVIDRLLSLSGNSSLLHDTTVTHATREQNEADLALTQLRELLAEKEVSVYSLRSESKELKDRLSSLESHLKSLEDESQERLKKINDLNNRLAEKTKINKSMAAVVEEYERTIASLISETAQDKKRHAEERAKLINERDEQTAHLASMEVSFSDLHSKYEKSKQVILNCKANEDAYKKSIKAFEENLTKMQNNYELLKQHATSKLNHANQELEKMNRSHEAEVLKLNAMIKRKELHITSLEESLAQKTKANDELTAICDELINKVG